MNIDIKMPNIIIEGPDRSGKTILRDRILSEIGDKLDNVHFTAPKKNRSYYDYVLIPGVSVFWQIYQWVWKKANKFEAEHSDMLRGTLFDRFAYSDTVYGPIYRNFSEVYFGCHEKLFLELFMESLGTVIIHCQLKSFEKNLKLIEDENEGILDREKLKTVRDAYNKIFYSNDIRLPIFHYDFTKNSTDEVIKFIQTEAKRRVRINDMLEADVGFGRILGNLNILTGDAKENYYNVIVLGKSKYNYNNEPVKYEDFMRAIIDYPQILDKDIFDSVVFVSGGSKILDTLMFHSLNSIKTINFSNPMQYASDNY